MPLVLRGTKGSELTHEELDGNFTYLDTKSTAVVLDTDDISEGATNLYFTTGRAAAAAPVQSVDGQTGAVSLSGSYAPLSHVGSGGTAHSAATVGTAGFMSAADKTKLDGIAAGAQVNVPTDLSLGTITTTSIPLNSSTGADVTLPSATTSLAGLQSAADKTKLDGVAAGATANANTDSLAEGATNKYFTEGRVRSTVLTGLSLLTGGVISAADSVLSALGKLQKQISDAVTAIGGKQDTLVSGTNLKTVNGNSLLGSGDLAISSGSGALPVVQALSASRNMTLADINTFNVNSTTNNYTATIQPQSTVAWTADAEIHFLPSNTGDIVVTAGAGVSLNGVVADSVTLSTQNGAASIKRLAADSWWIGGATGGTELLGDVAADSVRIGKSGTASNNFTWRNLLDGILRLSRGNAGSPITDVMRVKADNSVEFPGGIADKNQCTAWVNFNGTGTVAIRDSYNVSSITDNGTADFTVNLTTAMNNTNYSVIGTCGRQDDNVAPVLYLRNPPTTTQFRVKTVYPGVGYQDFEFNNIAVLGGR